ncbi:MAG TPA: hypothetical protein VG475_03835, partial [Pseudolabrys sp.]|nr:hypothetical protein [Pseudolabrys sp.]
LHQSRTLEAPVATIGERVVDVFYVTDLMGAQIASPTRQAAIKRALIGLVAKPEAGKSAGACARAKPRIRKANCGLTAP